MTQFVEIIIQIGFIILVILLFPCAFRAFKGPHAAERLQAIELFNTLLIGIIILLTLIQESSFVLDMAIALAAFGFIATVSIARYIADKHVF